MSLGKVPLRLVVAALVFLTSSCSHRVQTSSDKSQSGGTPTSADPGRGVKPLSRSTDFSPAVCKPPRYVAIPEDDDTVLQEYRRRKKYLVVIGASRYLDKEYDRPFVEESAKAVRDALLLRGYTELGFLVGQGATNENIRKALEKIQDLNENSTVLIYYAGHGVVSDGVDRDLYLQSADQEVGEFRGISVSQVLSIARNRIFKGRIILLIDSCYSSHTLLSPTIWSNVANKDTIVITSSNSKQQSWPFKPKDKPTMTAFGYFFAQALTADWACADTLPDGGLTVDELVYYTRRRLQEAYDQRAIEGEMQPDYDDPLHRTVVAYDNTKISEVASPIRNELVAVSLTDTSIKHLIAAAGDSGRVVVTENGAVVASINVGTLAGSPSTEPDLFVRLSSENSQHLTLELHNKAGKKIDSAEFEFSPTKRVEIEPKKEQDFQIEKYESTKGRYFGLAEAETSTVLRSNQ